MLQRVGQYRPLQVGQYRPYSSTERKIAGNRHVSDELGAMSYESRVFHNSDELGAMNDEFHSKGPIRKW